MASSEAEEFDPKTGEFRKIPAKRTVRPAPMNPAPKVARAAGANRPQVSGLSESGNRYGVFYEIFEGAAKSPAGKAAYRVSQGIILVVFLLLLYEAVTYRMALGG